MSNNLDPDQDRQNVGPDLGTNCLQQKLLLASSKSYCRASQDSVVTVV